MNNSISAIGTDIASRMLAAITLEDTSNEEQKESVPIEEQKRYLKKYIDTVSIDDRKAIGNILVMNNKRNALHACAEGTVINLDTLPVHIIEQMYNMIVYKMEKR